METFEVHEGPFGVTFPDNDSHDYDTIEEAMQAVSDAAFCADKDVENYFATCVVSVPHDFDTSNVKLPTPIRLCTPASKPPFTMCSVCNGSSFSADKKHLACQECCGTGVAGEKAYRKKKQKL